ncbi:glycosyltransferase family 39 protein, partial [Candidatus Parcubacteria bacterium]|nr:glycosyltransferase family 39 protein [Candidatus Parcubacteria bacterium]
MSKTRVALTKSQKKYLKNHLKEKTLGEIASHLEVPIEDLTWYLEKRWGKEKFQKFSAKREQNPFNFRTWWRQNRLKLGLLVFLVTAAYINSLGNDFVADDVGAIANNEDINQAGYIFSNRLRFLRPLIYSVVNQMSGLRPAFYRLTNILFHLGTVLTLYLLLYLLINPTAALLTAVLTAVHPIMTEAVTWISGGSHAQYSFFGLSSLLAYLLATREKKYYPLSLIFLLLALLSSEKAVVLPIIFLAFEMANKNLTKNWKKLIIPLMMSGFLITISTRAIAPRMETLQTHFYQKPSTLNPLTQIPIAITSYLELIFWPKN